MQLKQLGFDASLEFQFESYAASGHVPGRVAAAIRGEYRVVTENGEYQAEPTGSLVYGAASAAELPAVGDWVALRVVGAGYAIVHAVLPRRTKLSRRAAGTREDEQVLAANVDFALVVCGLDGDFNPRRIERYLAVAHENGVVPVLVLSKADLCANLEERLQQARAVARGTPLVAISSVTEHGLSLLVPWLEAGKTFVLLGSSGAGKSTLLNRLIGDGHLRTGAVRESDSRGRHTTTNRELFVLPSGAILIDSPGMREVRLWATHNSLDQTFDDITDLATRCRFRNCSHSNEPGCAVRQALDNGDVDVARWRNYRKLEREIQHHEALTDRQAALAQKQRWKMIHRAIRTHYKLRGKGDIS